MTQSRARIFSLVKNVVSFPKPVAIIETLHDKKSDKFCLFHKVKGHNTEQCTQLQDTIEDLVREGHLKEFVHHPTKTAGPKEPQQGRPGTSQDQKPPESVSGWIKESNRAKKRRLADEKKVGNPSTLGTEGHIRYQSERGNKDMQLKE